MTRNRIQVPVPLLVLCPALVLAGAVIVILTDRAMAMYVALLGTGIAAVASLLWPRLLPAALAVGLAGAACGLALVLPAWPPAPADVPALALDLLLVLATLTVVSALASRAGSGIRAIIGEVQFRDGVIGELTRRDPETTAYKPQYARRMLQEEIERARRYRRPLSFVVLAVDNWESLVNQRGEEEMRRCFSRLSDIAGDNLRLMDKLSRHSVSRLALLLPETPLAGAQIVAERVLRQGEADTGLALRAGVVEFPADGEDAESLVREADSAVALAVSAGLPMVSRALLAR
jgi:diguanylate cyclase (GGDEF)-like protein